MQVEWLRFDAVRQNRHAQEFAYGLDRPLAIADALALRGWVI